MKEEYVLKNILSNRLGSEDYKIVQYLNENNISYIQGLTWTTDAIFRETAKDCSKENRWSKDCRNGTVRMYSC